jgi:hypothetical protein
MNLWLDDIRKPPEGWHWVKTPAQIIALLEMFASPTLIGEDIEWISFDHDLGIDPEKAEAYNTGKIQEHKAEMTGYEVVLWMAEHNVWPTQGCIVHSANPVGAKNIRGVIDRYGPYDKPCPWNPTWLDSTPIKLPENVDLRRLAEAE